MGFVLLLFIAGLVYFIIHAIIVISKRKQFVDNPKLRRKYNKRTAFIVGAELILLIIMIANIGDAEPAHVENKSNPTESMPEEPIHSKWDDWVAKYTSAWDGSCRPVEKAIKNALNDPGSYDHDATGYVPNEDTSLIVVTTRFRANNGFGAKVLAVYQATVDVNGNVIDIKELE